MQELSRIEPEEDLDLSVEDYLEALQEKPALAEPPGARENLKEERVNHQGANIESNLLIMDKDGKRKGRRSIIKEMECPPEVINQDRSDERKVLIVEDNMFSRVALEA